MILVDFLKGKTVLVVGLGKSGLATAAALKESGANVAVWDDTQTQRDKAKELCFPLADPENLTGTDLVVWSPGIPHTYPKDKANPIAARARALGIPLICDVELLGKAKPENRKLAITGTNGKSTTTTLLAHVLKSAGRDVAAGGNLGIAALDLPDLLPEGRYVLELSSYQLELIPTLALDVGVLLNITPDHLGRHGGMEGYIAAKAKMFDAITADGLCVIGVDDEHCQKLAAQLHAQNRRVVEISVTRDLPHGVSAKDGILRENGVELVDLNTIARLPGSHNWQNACAVYAMARADGVPPELILRGLASYPGLAHRQEFIRDLAGVAYINDSKATNADATEKAMVCYPKIHWIIGGQSKEGGIEALRPYFSRVVHAYLIGEAAQDFAQTLGNDVAFTQCGTLDVAVAKAHQAAKSGEVVLLSPACASWDQFKSFEHRGDTFRALVEAL